MNRLDRGVARLQYASWRVLRPRHHSAFRELLRSQWKSADELRADQERRLRLVAAVAAERSPFYGRRFAEAGVDPETIRLEDLWALPILEKDEIREHTALLATGIPGRPNQTGGSTGHPLFFIQNKEYLAYTVAELHRDYTLCGYEHGDPIAFLWGSDFDARSHNGALGRLKDWIQNLDFLNTFQFDEAALDRFGRRLLGNPPKLLVGYVSALATFARYLQAAGRTIPIGAVQTAAEALTAADRELFEVAFQAPVYNRYGCREVGNIAHECPAHDGLHELTDNNILEVVGEDGRPVRPGHPGHVLVTNLHNIAMPFIRYRIGNVAVTGSASPCACGRASPRLQAVYGRTADMITTPSGRLIHGEFFSHLFYKLPGVRQFRVEQPSLAEIVITVSPTEALTAKTEAFLRGVISSHGDPSLKVYFRPVERIDPNASGKFRFTVSSVPVTLGRTGQ